MYRPTAFAPLAALALSIALSACGSSSNATSSDGGVDATRVTVHDASLDGAHPTVDGSARDAGGGAPQDAGPAPCPTKPPADLTDPDIVARCTETLYVAGGNRSLRITSTDLDTWSNVHVDHTNCLAGDASLNCGQTGLLDGGVYNCDHKDPSQCTPFYDGIDCSFTDPHDPKATDCAGFDDGAFGVAFGLGLIVASSDFGVFTSADNGATWTKAPAPAQQQWGQAAGHVSSAAFGNGMFLVVGGDTTLTSTDGYAWTSSTFSVDGGGTGYWGFHNFVYGNGHFVAVGTQRTAAGDIPFVKVTDDGVSWHGVLTNADLSNVVFDGTQFYAVGLKGRRATSPDGVTWTTVASDDPACTDPNAWTGAPDKCLGNLTLVASGDGKYLVCGGACALSIDNGATWSRTKVWTYLPLFYARSRFYDLNLQWTVDGGAWQTDDAGPPAALVKLGLQHIQPGLVLKQP